MVYDRALTREEVLTLYQSKGANASKSPSRKILTRDSKTIILPSFVENRCLPGRRPAASFSKYYTLEEAKSGGQINATFDLSSLIDHPRKYQTCHFAVQVANEEVAGTDAAITLSTKGIPIKSIEGATPGQTLKFELPLKRIQLNEALKLNIKCGTDELLLEKSAPGEVKLILE